MVDSVLSGCSAGIISASSIFLIERWVTGSKDFIRLTLFILNNSLTGFDASGGQKSMTSPLLANSPGSPTLSVLM